MKRPVFSAAEDEDDGVIECLVHDFEGDQLGDLMRVTMRVNPKTREATVTMVYNGPQPTFSDKGTF